MTTSSSSAVKTTLWNTELPYINWEKIAYTLDTERKVKIPNIFASAVRSYLGTYLKNSNIFYNAAHDMLSDEGLEMHEHLNKALRETDKASSEGQVFLRSLGVAAAIPFMTYKKGANQDIGAAYRGYNVISTLNDRNSISVPGQLKNHLKMALIHLIAMISSIPAVRLDITFYKLLCLIFRVICIALSPLFMLIDAIKLIAKKSQKEMNA